MSFFYLLTHTHTYTCPHTPTHTHTHTSDNKFFDQIKLFWLTSIVNKKKRKKNQTKCAISKLLAFLWAKTIDAIRASWTNQVLTKIVFFHLSFLCWSDFALSLFRTTPKPTSQRESTHSIWIAWFCLGVFLCNWICTNFTVIFLFQKLT